MKIKYSEIFGKTIQGEGYYNGRITNWIRFFSCNLNCDGFGQKDPTDPSTYVLPYQEFDVKSIKKVEDLPVWDKGCDSSYSWSKQFAHLSKSNTELEIADMLTQLNVSDTNPEGLWIHPVTKNNIHLAFTGGEPMMQQDSVLCILEALIDTGNYPRFITIETNATKPLKQNFIEKMTFLCDMHSIELFFSMSPKLFSVSGEKPEKAWKPEIVSSYIKLSDRSQIKFVVNESCLDELVNNTSEVLEMFQEHWEYTNCEFWVMPVGATLEGQLEHDSLFIEKLIEMGYNVSDRTHVRLFGNSIGK